MSSTRNDPPMAKTSAQSLVYLREKDGNDSQLLDRSGLQRMRTSVEWFEDHSCAPQHNAKYLKKLATLRSGLIQQEQANFNKTLNRLNRDNSHGKSSNTTLSNSKPKATTNQETYPDRFKRLQKQRQELLERRHKVDRSVKIDQIKGEKLFESAPNKEQKNSESGDSIDIFDVIAFQQARLNQTIAVQNGVAHSNVHHQSSIPNLDRKSLKHPKQLLSFEKYNHRCTDTFTRQMSLHQKDPRGLYKGANRRQLLRGDQDEIDLTPDAFRFETPIERSASNSASMDSIKQYSVPASTPVQWHDSTVKLPRVQSHSEAGEMTRGIDDAAMQETSATAVPVGMPQEGMSSKPVQYHPSIGPLHPSLLRTTTSYYAPASTGYIRLLETENQKANRGHHRTTGTRMKGPVTSKWNSSRSQQEDESQQSTSGSERFESSSQRTDLCHNYPDAVAFQAEFGDVMLVNQSDTGLDFTFDETPEMTCRNTPEDTGITTTTTKELKTMSGKKVSLIVQMPDIVLNPPTPTRLVHSADEIVSLRKTFRQNELREKEVVNLLEDVKELTEMSEDLRRVKTNIAF